MALRDHAWLSGYRLHDDTASSFSDLGYARPQGSFFYLNIPMNRQCAHALDQGPLLHGELPAFLEAPPVSPAYSQLPSCGRHHPCLENDSPRVITPQALFAQAFTVQFYCRLDGSGSLQRNTARATASRGMSVITNLWKPGQPPPVRTF